MQGRRLASLDFFAGAPAAGVTLHVRTHFSRPDFLAGVRDMSPPLIGLLPFGLVCGVAAQALGASVWGALGMSAIIFSGAAQIVAAQLIAAQAPIAVIVLTCFVVGLRLMMYSAAMAPHLKPLPPRWRNVLAYVLTDQAFAASIRRFTRAERPVPRRVVFPRHRRAAVDDVAGIEPRRLLARQRAPRGVVARLRRAAVLSRRCSCRRWRIARRAPPRSPPGSP